MRPGMVRGETWLPAAGCVMSCCISWSMRPSASLSLSSSANIWDKMEQRNCWRKAMWWLCNYNAAQCPNYKTDSYNDFNHFNHFNQLNHTLLPSESAVVLISNWHTHGTLMAYFMAHLMTPTRQRQWPFINPSSLARKIFLNVWVTDRAFSGF